MCVSACPYKKIYYNWRSGKSEKCIFCYPRIEAGQPTVCSETCVGRIRYLGVVMYDADRIEEAASAENPEDLYQAQLDIFLDPHDPAVIRQALQDGVPQAWIDAAQRSPVYRMAMGLEDRLPAASGISHFADGVVMCPPLSPIQAAAEAAHWARGADPGCLSAAYPAEIPCQHVDRWRRSPGQTGPGADAGDAGL